MAQDMTPRLKKSGSLCHAVHVRLCRLRPSLLWLQTTSACAVAWAVSPILGLHVTSVCTVAWAVAFILWLHTTSACAVAWAGASCCKPAVEEELGTLE